MRIILLSNGQYGLYDTVIGLIASGTKRQMEKLLEKIDNFGQEEFLINPETI